MSNSKLPYWKENIVSRSFTLIDEQNINTKKIIAKFNLKNLKQKSK